MIEFDVLEADFRIRDEKHFDIFTDTQNLTDSKKSVETLDDFLDKVDVTTVTEKKGGYAFHVRTKPIKEKRKWYNALKLDLGLWGYIGKAVAGKSIDKYFGIETDGAHTRVIETSTPEGVVLDIFYNVDTGSIVENMAESYYNFPTMDSKDSFALKVGKVLWNLSYAFSAPDLQKDTLAHSREFTNPGKSEKRADKGRQRRQFAKALETLGQVYEKLGVSEGRVVLSPELWRGEHLTDKLDLIVDETDSSRNCTFYQVSIPETEGVEKRGRFRPGNDNQPKKSKVIRKTRDKDGSKNVDDIYFKDVVGVDEAIAKMQNAKKYFANPQKFIDERGFGLSPGCILYGPPGTGKTMLAKAFANETEAPIIVYKASDILNKYVGESDKALEGLFSEAEVQAKKHGKCVIFIDEFEQIARKRGAESHETSNRLVDSLLTYLDGFSDKGNVYIIGATNLIEDIDPALRHSKGGRLEEVKIGAPNYKGRQKIVSDAIDALKGRAKIFPFAELDYNRIAVESEGLTGRLLVGKNQSILRTLADKYHDARESNPNTPLITTDDWVVEIQKYHPKKKGKMGFTAGDSK